MTRLTFVGDIACDRPLLKAAYSHGKYDFSQVFQTDDIFQASDLVVGNLETCFGGAHYGKKPYHYSVPDSFGDAIRDAGFQVLSTANNHCLDEGLFGLKRTNFVLDKLGIAHTGTFSGEENEKRYLVVERNGIRIGFYALTYSVNNCFEASTCGDVSRYVNILGFRPRQYSQNPVKRFWQVRLRPGLKKQYLKWKKGTIIPAFSDKLTEKSFDPAWLERVDEHICAVREEADVLVVLLHIGGQFNTEPGEFSRYMVDHLCRLDVDIIAGHHPHTIQRFEKRGKTYIAYSLGAFCLSPSADYLVRESLPEYGAAWHVDIDERKHIVGSSVQLIKCTEDTGAYLTVKKVSEGDQGADSIRTRCGLND